MNINFRNIPKFCISLPESTGRRTLVQDQFDKFGLDVRIIDAHDGKKYPPPYDSVKNILNPITAGGYYGCIKSHTNVMRIARHGRMSSVCIFEDDIVFCDDFWDRINYLETLHNFDWDLISLGGHWSYPDISRCALTTEWEYIYRTIFKNGTYAYIIKQNVYNHILDTIDFNYSMDEFFSRIYPNFKCYSFSPFLVGTYKNKSTITGEEWEYESAKKFYQQKGLWTK